MNGVSLDTRTCDGFVVAQITGEVDMADAAALGRAIEHRIGATAEGIVVDLTAVSYLDSAGIHLLYDLERRLAERSLRMRIVVPTGSVVEDTLRYADALRMLDVRRSVEDALSR